MEDLNVRPQEPRDEHEEELETVLEDRGLVDMTSHFTPWRWYRGSGCWTWQMQREGRQVMERGDYILIIYRHKFSNAEEPLGGSGGALQGRSTSEPQVLTGKDTLVNKAKDGATTSRGGGVFFDTQRGRRQDAATNSGVDVLDLSGDMAVI